MLAGLFAATEASGPPAPAGPPRTPGSTCATTDRGSSSRTKATNSGNVRRVMEPPPLRVRETLTPGSHQTPVDAAGALLLLPMVSRHRAEGRRCHDEMPPFCGLLVKGVLTLRWNHTLEIGKS